MGSSFFDFDNLPIFGHRPIKDDPNYVRKPAERKARREQGVAGSYNHIVNNNGNLVGNERFVGMVENLGDAYETVEEMYGMIWWLASTVPETFSAKDIKDRIEVARENYQEGLKLAKKINGEVNRGSQS